MGGYLSQYTYKEVCGMFRFGGKFRGAKMTCLGREKMIGGLRTNGIMVSVHQKRSTRGLERDMLGEAWAGVCPAISSIRRRSENRGTVIFVFQVLCFFNKK